MQKLNIAEIKNKAYKERKIYMFIKQVSIFVENKSGTMADVLEILGKNNIDLSALSIADTTDFGILRLIVSDPYKAEKILKENGMVVKLTNVIAVGIEDKPGSLSTILNTLKENNMEIDYMYAFIGKTSHGALVIMKTGDNEKTIDILSQNGIKTVDASEIYDVN